MEARSPRFEHFLQWGALLVIAVSPTQFGVPLLKLGRATVALTVADVLIWLLALAIVGRVAVTLGRWRPTVPPVHLWLLAVIAGLCAAAWLSPALEKKDILGVAKELLQWVGYLVAAPLVFLNAFASPASRRRALAVLTAATAVIVALGLVQMLAEHFGVAGREWLFATRTRELAPIPHDAGNVVGLFGSRTVYSLQLALVLPLVFASVLATDRRRGQWLPVALFVIGAATVCAPGILLALLVAVVAVALAAGSDVNSRARAIVVACGLLGLAIAFAPFRAEKGALGLTYPRLEEGAPAPITTIDNRYAEWGAVMQMVGTTQWPVAGIGVGPGQYQGRVGGFLGVLPKFGKLEPDFQGGWFVVLAELGFAGLLGLAFLYCRSAGLAWRLRGLPDAPGDRVLAVGAFGSSVGMLAANLYGFPLVKGTGVTLMLLASLVVACALSHDRKEETE